MEYISWIDNKIDDILEDNILYSTLILILIVYATFTSGTHSIDKPNKLDKFIKLRFDVPIIKILFIMLIVYFGAKDIRVSLLLLIIFFIEIEKVHVEEVQGELIALIVNDTSITERLKKLETKY
jgi:hypothetical protein